jgi:hypothetical protein
MAALPSLSALTEHSLRAIEREGSGFLTLPITKANLKGYTRWAKAQPISWECFLQKKGRQAGNVILGGSRR